MNPDYKLYHPRWYRTRMPIFWWLGKLSYTKFIIRELTSLAVGYAAILLLVQIWALSRGVHDRFAVWLQTPVVLFVHALVLLVLLFHSITWLNLAPSALVLRIGGRRIPDQAVLIAHYLGWIAASGLVYWYLVK